VGGLFNMTLDQSTAPRAHNNRVVEDYVGRLLVGALGSSGQNVQPEQHGVFIPPGVHGLNESLILQGVTGPHIQPMHAGPHIQPLHALRIQQQFLTAIPSHSEDIVNV
jgi:hypothetical protein